MQVLLDQSEYDRLQGAAKSRGLSLAEWVRQALRAAYRREPRQDPDKQLAAIRAAARNEYPAGEIDQMLSEIERGYLEE